MTRPSHAAARKPLALSSNSDLRFLQGGLETEVFERTPKANAALWLMLGVCVSFIVWAAWAHVDEVTKAEGHVVADGREQTLGSLEGGILDQLLVREGAVVEKDQPLVQIDPLRFASQQNEGDARRMALKAAIARLEAETDGHALVFPKELQSAPANVTAVERASYLARRRALDEAVAGTRHSLKMLESELAMSERLASQGLMSEVEVMRLKRQQIELNGQIDDRVNRFRQDAVADLSRLRTELAQQDQQAMVRKDALQRTLLRSPVRGIVKSIRYSTVGGVIPAGQPVVDILPLGPRILVEARIKASQIGFVKTGQAATVKLATYDYNVYGALQGKIDFLSPDAISEEGKAPTADGPSFRAIVAVDGDSLHAGGKPLPVLPGMTATVEIRTGDRTVLDYLMRPMLKSREALRER
jgi:adhesin transport system membrane fusion protein